jgi:hypothetical protein
MARMDDEKRSRLRGLGSWEPQSCMPDWVEGRGGQLERASDSGRRHRAATSHVVTL